MHPLHGIIYNVENTIYLGAEKNKVSIDLANESSIAKCTKYFEDTVMQQQESANKATNNKEKTRYNIKMQLKNLEQKCLRDLL